MADRLRSGKGAYAWAGRKQPYAKRVTRATPIQLANAQLRRSIAQDAQAAAAMEVVNPANRGLQLTAGEWKSIDKTGTAAVRDTGPIAGTLICINACSRGTDIGTRVARQFTMRSLELRYSVKLGATPTNQAIRVLVFYDRQANGALPAIADVLQAATVTAPRNLENRNRFKILYDRLHVLETAGPTREMVRWYRKLRHPTQFNTGNDGTVGDIATGSLFVLAFGTIAADDNTRGEWSYNTRVRFQDA